LWFYAIGQSPSTFENDFNNTFEIEPNSEVALHSIALNRLPQYDISDKFFYVYHGVTIDEDGEPDNTNAFGGENMYRLSEASLIKLSNGKYGYTELATEIQRFCTERLGNDTHRDLELFCWDLETTQGQF
jgi:hypothetical protein